ncbi:MAG: glutamine-hydrolyzing GMP synthase, partial [Actinomycetota bacterium]
MSTAQSKWSLRACRDCAHTDRNSLAGMKVLVAMSGGVDSSVAAAELRR